MIRTKPAKENISQKLALELFSSDAYLILNKKLLSLLGPEKTIFLSNLIDKFKYFQKRYPHTIVDGWFFRSHKEQIKETGLTNYAIQKCKKQLQSNKIISIKKQGIPAKEWVKINFNIVLELTDSIGQELTDSIGHNNNELIYNDNISKDTSSDSAAPITPSLFEEFWNLYPKKIDKGKAKTKWEQLCRKKDRPNWKTIKGAIIKQKKTPRWEEKKFIPHPTTWLNQQRWLDDPEEMISYDGAKKPTTKQTPPKQILRDHFGKRDWYGYILKSALDLISDHNNVTKSELAYCMCTIDDWYLNKQKEMDRSTEEWKLIPDSFHLIEKYIEWLDRQDWIKDVTVSLFDHKSKVFKKFLRYYQEEVGLDFFDGSSL